VDQDPDSGNLRPTALISLLGWALVGLVGGWAVHPLCERLGVVPPLVTAPQPLALLLLAAILGYVAWATHRAVQVRRERLEAHKAVNRLVLARASALVGALVAGGYLGYAISWIGDPAELADDRLVRSLIATGCAVAAMVAALLLERACRVREDDPEPR
jgi:heme A synthase